jgi:Dehydrogenase E1 component
MKAKSEGPRAAHARPAQKTVSAETEAVKSEFSLIPPATLEALYAAVLKGRMLEGRLKQSDRRDDAAWKTVKAGAAAVLLDLRADDLVATAREVPLVQLLRGDKPASAVGERDPGNLLLHAVGTALANRTNANGKVAVVFWHDAGLAAWQDALEMARAHTLPLILVCPANQEEVRDKGLKPGTELPRIIVDGYDAVAVYRVAHEAIDRARRNRGASLIECASFRVKGSRGGHGDAVVNMERYLKGKGLLRRGMRQKIELELAAKLQVKRKGKLSPRS